MKYVIYFLSYFSSLGSAPISGAIGIDYEKYTVTTYLYNVGYVEWGIVDEEGVYPKDNTITRGTYVLKRGQFTSVLHITPEQVYQFINTDPPIHITIKRKEL